jgi:hypothetical protein
VNPKILRQFGSALGYPLTPVRRGLQVMADVQRRERLRLASEIAQTRELMPLLMKQRNGLRWSDEDRRVLKKDMRALAHLSPYLVLFVAPGGFFVMPVLAWWLDRRRNRRPESAEGSPAE